MNKQQAEKVFSDFQYLKGTIVNHMEGKPTITHLTIDKGSDNEYYVRIHAESPHPSIGNSLNEFIQNYCKKTGISYDFP